jgi:alpha 1,2-mannosyltransferase
MRDNDMAYGFNMAILDDARSFPSLWERTKAFRLDHYNMLHEEADLDWLLHSTEDDDCVVRGPSGYQIASGDEEYNNCQFYSNFEVGSLDFFRSEEHQAYFEHLDKAGGFYYERYGDAPIHTLSVSMFLPKRRVWFFRDIGYAHGLCEQCPPHASESTNGAVPDHRRMRAVEWARNLSSPHRRWAFMANDVKRQMGIPGLACGCTVSALDNNFSKLVPFESKQRKPCDTCIRRWLGGKWLDKKPDYDVAQAAERGGGDGSGRYVLDGLQGNHG